MDEGEGVIIDGRCSFDGANDFVDIRLDMTLGEEGVSTTQELNRCKKTVLVFYLNFLKVVSSVYRGTALLMIWYWGVCMFVQTLQKSLSKTVTFLHKHGNLMLHRTIHNINGVFVYAKGGS